MTVISTPKTTFAITSAPQTVENAPQQVLFVGQFTGTAVTAGSLVKNIGSAGEESALFGQRSMLATMIREFRKINTVSRVDAIPLADPGGVAATSDILFAGTATEDGSLTFYVQSRELHKFEVPVSNLDTAEDISNALAALITADTTVLVTASDVTADTTELTASFLGTEGNSIGLQLVGSVAGITVTMPPMAGGTLSPTTAGIFSVVGDIRYQTVVWPSSYTKSDVTGFLDPRFNPTGQVLDGVAISAETDSAANLITSVSTLNSESFTLLGNKTVSIADNNEGSALFEFNPTISSQFAAIRALRLTPGQNIASFLVGGGLTNAFGGPSRASTPYHNTPFSLLPIIELEEGWSLTEQDQLKAGGVSFLGNNTALNTVIAGDIVTTYLTNSAGDPDETFKFLNYVDTASNIREFYWNNNKSQYAQTVLTDGDLVPGINMANANSIAAFQEQLYSELAGIDANGVLYGLTQAGKSAQDFFSQNLLVTVALETGTVTISAKVPIVTQLREIDGTLQIVFDINTAG